MLYSPLNPRLDEELNSPTYLEDGPEEDFEEYFDEEEFELEEKERLEIEKELLEDLYTARYPIR